MTDLSGRERRRLALIYPEGTVAVGLTDYFILERRGLVQRRFGRYSITDAGAEAIRHHPEGVAAMAAHQKRKGWGRR